ncbi:MAG: tetratricopeptide repeat protein [Tannerellaceae bacterium]|jgi:tetratricopeptide (TPR) repeat protein|nr:tetratricopeptide repeat protein [Tannerellaceae bacterium]
MKKRFIFVITGMMIAVLAGCNAGSKENKADAFDKHQLAGTLSMAEGDYRSAVESYEKALAINPAPNDHALVYRGLASSYFKLEKYDEALIYLKKAIDVNPGYALNYALSGTIYNKQKKYDKCMEALETYIALKPEDIESYQILSNACFEAKKYAKAIHYAQEYLKYHPDDADMYLLTGMCHVADGGNIYDIAGAFLKAAELGSDKASKYLQMIMEDAARQSGRE